MFDPELLIYNAGTDILDGDPLGKLKVTYHLRSLRIYLVICCMWFLPLPKRELNYIEVTSPTYKRLSETL